MEPAQKFTISVRMPESLRVKLASAAQANELSLNQEIMRRLERSFEDEQELGGPQGMQMASLIASTVGIIQATYGASYLDDPTVRSACRAAVDELLNHVLPRSSPRDKTSIPRKDLEATLSAAEEFGREAAGRWFEELRIVNNMRLAAATKPKSSSRKS